MKWLSQEIEGSKGDPKLVETRLATFLPTANDRHSLNKPKLARPNSPKATFDTTKRAGAALLWVEANAEKSMCRRASCLEENPIMQNLIRYLCLHAIRHIQAEAHGGFLLLSKASEAAKSLPMGAFSGIRN